MERPGAPDPQPPDGGRAAERLREAMGDRFGPDVEIPPDEAPPPPAPQEEDDAPEEDDDGDAA